MLDQLVNGEGSIVRLDDGIRDLGRGHDGERRHHAVGELFTDLGDQEGTHTGTSTTSERVGDLEALQAVAGLSLAADNVDDLIDELSTLGVVTLGPVVASARLAVDEVVRAEKLAERTRAHGLDGARLQINEDGTRHILVAAGLLSCQCRCRCLNGIRHKPH